MENGPMFNSKILVLKDLAQERYNICKSCPRLNSVKICTICNCVMPVKVKFAVASCPAGKWPAVTDTEKTSTTAYNDLT